MKTIAILSQKGGTGKTTISLHLAVAAQQAGHAAVVIDLDPQASSAGWKDSRSGEEPVVVSAPASRLSQRVLSVGGCHIAPRSACGLIGFHEIEIDFLSLFNSDDRLAVSILVLPLMPRPDFLSFPARFTIFTGATSTL